MTGLSLSKVLADFPGVQVEKVDFLLNMSAARAQGVRGIPTLLAEGEKLSGILLTKKGIREFLQKVTGAESQLG